MTRDLLREWVDDTAEFVVLGLFAALAVVVVLAEEVLCLLFDDHQPP